MYARDIYTRTHTRDIYTHTNLRISVWGSVLMVFLNFSVNLSECTWLRNALRASHESGCCCGVSRLTGQSPRFPLLAHICYLKRLAFSIETEAEWKMWKCSEGGSMKWDLTSGKEKKEVQVMREHNGRTESVKLLFTDFALYTGVCPVAPYKSGRGVGKKQSVLSFIVAGHTATWYKQPGRAWLLFSSM